MCMIDDADGPADWSNDRWHKARKAHRCDECGRQIAVGERYRYCAMKWDGEIDQYHTCAHCVVAEEWLRVECRGWIFGAVKEDLSGHLVYGPWSTDESRQPFKVNKPARLLAGMCRKWLRFDGSGELMAVPA